MGLIELPLRGLDGSGNQQALVDFTESDGEGLLIQLGVYQRANVLEQALVELSVVSVDLACALGTKDDQSVLRVGSFKQRIDRGIDDAFGLCS